MNKTFAFTIALLVSAMTAPSHAFGALVIPALRDWSLSFQDQESLMDESHPFLPTPRPRTFTEMIAGELVGYGINSRESSVVLGRRLSPNVRIYVAHRLTRFARDPEESFNGTFGRDHDSFIGGVELHFWVP